MVDLVLSRPGISNSAEKHWSKALPLGVGYLAAAARACGINVYVVDGKLEGHHTIDHTVTAILSHQPNVVGLSALTVEYPAAMEIAGCLKRFDSGITTVLGGAHANALPAEALIESQAFDYVIAGEAETALPELIFALKTEGNLNQIPGLYMRKGDGSIKNVSPPRFGEDLTKIPFPAWDLFPRSDTYPIMTERGCPFKCVFCSRNMSQKVRRRPVEHVMEEIKWLHKDFAPAFIYFEDETFGLHPGHTQELLGRLIEFNRQAKMRFKAQTRVDRVSKQMVQMMKKAGFEYLELGVESGDPDVLSRSEKGIRLEQVERAVKIARDVGIKVWLKFIIGLPDETKDSVQRTINFAVKLNPDRISVAVIVAYPGSRIYEWARKGEYGYRLVSNKWDKFDKYLSSSLELDTLSCRMLRRLQVQMYLETYLRNRRFRELALMLLKNRFIAWSLWRDLISSTPD